jgi:hypothetical protein
MSDFALLPQDVPPVERQIAGDIIRRAFIVLPLLVAVATAIWGWAGGLSAAFAVGLVIANFAVSALLLSWAAGISATVLMATTMVSFLVRMVIVTASVYAVKDQSWVNLFALAITLLTTHLGLLAWEARYLSISLAFPGLRPRQGD